MEFTELDYRILKYLKGKDFVHISVIDKKMKISCLDRILILAQKGYISQKYERIDPKKNDGEIMREYDEYKYNERQSDPILKNYSYFTRKEWIKLWVPIIISIIATIISLFGLFMPKQVSEEDIRQISQEQIEKHTAAVSDNS